ncbi:beta-lactamase class A [Acetobacter nitrogenifigens DSM 23921 = NBRC 105050]|uniref:Beta-lactamase n=1 Tax=Acetobacter nitrogenifigens DSM 23921 = NBRC 105050 TaxID=1120919 RepID=A0A511X6X8_9PROT|nr:class A beta-lactamase [Acetobacter nitrogenifigens]GBQ95112.1 beta-lactamase class A [Acetobacter nitrogenifigens DSM 23921 = NBRC 105050]GEN58713.1 beta-lactamase [Acetobacter nitrogenifigens DSM 23921 = NBRC 105050]
MRRRRLLQYGSVVLASPAYAVPAAPQAIATYERESRGHIGVYAENLATGRKLLWRADERFVMCSTFKASLAACVLRRVDRGQEKLDRIIAYTKADVPDWYAPVARENLARGSMTVAEMCQAAVEQSDNTCATLLLSSIGGPAALTAFWRSIGDTQTRLEDPEPYLNRTPPGGVRDTTTPSSMAKILQRVALGDVLSDSSRALLTGWLVGCQTGANRLRAGLPKTWRVGDKTGNNAKDAAGDIAVLWPKPDAPIIVAVYTRGGTPTDAQLASAFAGVGALVAETLG